MKVQRKRYGFATNSSSLHSMVMLKKPVMDKWDDNWSFGWDFFTLGSKNAKLSYVASMVAYHVACGIPEFVPSDVRNRVVAATTLELMGLSEPPVWTTGGESWCGKEGAGWLFDIDHQSQMSLPRKHGGRSPGRPFDERFIRDLVAYVSQDNVAILGGNDNINPDKGEGHPLLKKRRAEARPAPFSLGQVDDEKRWRSPMRNLYDVGPRTTFVGKRHERDGHVYWTLMNEESGTKTLIAMTDDAPPLRKAQEPELIDIKVTDYCHYGCKYCYQGSTRKGEHADVAYIRHIVNVCRELGVMEVALGGGEPTSHPDILHILSLFHHEGVTANITTRDTQWVEKLRDHELSHIGAIAISVDTLTGVYQVERLLENKSLRNKLNAQVVLGSVKIDDFRSIMDKLIENDVRTTLLGWKSTHRGATAKPYPHNDWFDAVRGAYMIGVDTALAQQFPKLMKKIDPDGMYHYTEEGKFSMYIDAVAQKMGPSSYCESLRMRPLPAPEEFEANDDLEFGSKEEREYLDRRDAHRKGSIEKSVGLIRSAWERW